MWLLLWYIWFCRPFVFCLFRVAFFYTSRTLFFQAVAPLHSHLFRFVILLWTRPHDQVTRSLYSWLCYIVFPDCLLSKLLSYLSSFCSELNFCSKLPRSLLIVLINCQYFILFAWIGRFHVFTHCHIEIQLWLRMQSVIIVPFQLPHQF